MSFFYYISSKNYINTNLKLFNSKKIGFLYIIIVIYLIISPYILLNISKYFIIILEITFITVFKSLYIKNHLRIVRDSCLFYLYTGVLNQFINEKYYINNNIKFLKLSFPYYCKVIQQLNHNEKRLYCLFYIICYQSIEYIHKLLILNLICLLYTSDAADD